MGNTERVVKNVNATMSMENLALTNEDIERIKKCVDGKISFDKTVETLVQKYLYK
jgi:phosphoheptose isomerase